MAALKKVHILCLHDGVYKVAVSPLLSQLKYGMCLHFAGQGFGLQASNVASATGVSGFGGRTSTGTFVVGTCGTSSPVIYAGAGSGATAVAATPGAQAAATAG